MATLTLTSESYIPTEASAPAPAARFRIESVDLLRGVVMILMALDHTRDFLGANTVNPTDLGHTTAPLFLTRWITHFCAPVFFLLMGTGAYLSLRKKSKGRCSPNLSLIGHFPAVRFRKSTTRARCTRLILTMVERSLFRAAYNPPIWLVLQQLNSAEWSHFCDHSVIQRRCSPSVGLEN